MKVPCNLHIDGKKKEKMRRIAKKNNRSMAGQLEQWIDETPEDRRKGEGRK